MKEGSREGAIEGELDRLTKGESWDELAATLTASEVPKELPTKILFNNRSINGKDFEFNAERGRERERERGGPAVEKKSSKRDAVARPTHRASREILRLLYRIIILL